jgi:hypothetical protein
MEVSKAQAFGDSFIGTRLRISGRDWVVDRSFPGDSGAEDDSWLVLTGEGGESFHLHYQDYDDGELAETGELIEYPDGQPESVRVRREQNKEA